MGVRSVLFFAGVADFVLLHTFTIFRQRCPDYDVKLFVDISVFIVSIQRGGSTAQFTSFRRIKERQGLHLF